MVVHKTLGVKIYNVAISFIVLAAYTTVTYGTLQGCDTMYTHTHTHTGLHTAIHYRKH